MPTSLPRVQVTIDAELQAALDDAPPSTGGRARALRELALRGAEARREELAARQRSIEMLVAIAEGRSDIGIEAARLAHEERERGFELPEP